MLGLERAAHQPSAQQQRVLLADIVENNAQAFTQISGLETLRQRVREYAFSREETRKHLRQTSHPVFSHSQQLAAPSFNPAAYGMPPLPAQPSRPPLPLWTPPQPQPAPRPASSYQPLQTREGSRALLPPSPLLHSISPNSRPVPWTRTAIPATGQTAQRRRSAGHRQQSVVANA